MSRPTVTVVVPVLNEEDHIEVCLAAIGRQTYPHVLEVLVVDGGSTDATTRLAEAQPDVRIVPNPRQIQAAALNVAIAEARGEILLRVDGHCQIAYDYVESCVAALECTGAPMVGGAMCPVAEKGLLQRGIAAAMASRVGAGPARFHTGGKAGWVDTVYLGAYRTDDARAVGGYAEDQKVNEDAEFAHRLSQGGSVWFDPSIRSTYTPRSSLTGLARQFWRYGRGRAETVRKHPTSLSPRQLAAPLLVIGLVSPWRRNVLVAYLALVVLGAAVEVRSDPGTVPGFALSLPTMHLAWGAGFLVGVLRPGAHAARGSRQSRPLGIVGKTATDAALSG